MAESIRILVPEQRRQDSIRLPRPIWFVLVTIVLVAANFGAQFGILVYNHRRQNEAIRDVETLRGEITWRGRGPSWLRTVFGQQTMKTFDVVDGVVFPPEMAIFDRGTTGAFGLFSQIRTDRPSVDDASLGCVAKLRHLKTLNLRWTNVGDAGMVHVCKLDSLEELVLVGADVSDANIPQLTRLRNLKKLDVSLTLITGSGVGQLRAAPPSCSIEYRCRPTFAEYVKALNAGRKH